ncbi:MAG TPA: hypothetical protein VK815_08965 [Candidatus Acidoferrales bacterium]|jgi:hypothetical protein|nr:hypothetical protein [Candidatus Acidoferrales bacterium]
MKITLVATLCFLVAIFIYMADVVSAPINENNVGGIYADTNRIRLINYDYRGRYYAYFTTYSNLSKAPRWKFDSVEPPLSARSALLVSERYAHDLFPVDVEFTPTQVVLKRYLGDIWFYDVQLEPSSPKPYVAPMVPIEIAVLMDGKVAEREEEVLDPTGQRFVPKR